MAILDLVWPASPYFWPLDARGKKVVVSGPEALPIVPLPLVNALDDDCMCEIDNSC